MIRGLVYERIDIGNLKYCLQMQQNLPPEEWIVLMQQIVDGTEACFHISFRCSNPVTPLHFLYEIFQGQFRPKLFCLLNQCRKESDPT